jgi:hypothetical protein
VGRPCWAGAVKLMFLSWVSGALLNVSPANINRCSSSSPAQRVGRGGNSVTVLVNVGLGEGPEVEAEVLVPEATVKFRGSQKSKSCSEMTDRG